MGNMGYARGLELPTMTKGREIPPRGLPFTMLWRAGAVLFGIGISLLLAWLGSQSQLAKPHFEVVMYVGEGSTAEFFYADEFGMIVPDQSLTTPTVRGLNNLSFPLDDPFMEASFIQRFDPCMCEGRFLFQSVHLSSTFYAERVSFEGWTLGGGSETLTLEGTSLLLETAPATKDPQIVFYLDIERFSQRAETVAFWTIFGLLGATILFALGVFRGVRSLWLLRQESHWGFGRRRRFHVVEPVLPLSLAFIAAGVALLAAIQMLAGGYTIGTTLDEPLHVRHLARFF